MVLVFFLIIPSVMWVLLLKFEGEEPAIRISPSSLNIGTSQIQVSVSDKKSGIKKLWVGLLKESKETVLIEKNFPASFVGRGKIHEKTFSALVEPKKMGITDGKAILRVVVRDYSWRHWGHGNKAYIENEVMIDTRPPGIHVLSKSHNVSQGGSNLVIYRLSEPCLRSGLFVGKNFFPAYSCPDIIKDANTFMVLFAVGYKQDPNSRISVEATDLAGNTGRAGFPYYIRKSNFRKDAINIPDKFLNWKVPEFENEIQMDSKLSVKEKFIMINNTLRKENEERFTEIVKKSDNKIYWEGDFLRFPGKRMASFADYREYKYNGEVIDAQTHMGIDIASVAESPVPASNHGKVVFAGHIGIYGETVIIDHGTGLFTTYSHLTKFSVKEGQMVKKGDIIGTTGITGLAGGDHLHFGVIVHNTFVNPIEWWDLKWVKNNILNKIKGTE